MPTMRRSDLWCPYCGVYAATWDGNELRCEACGRIAQIDYGQVVGMFGPRKAQGRWERQSRAEEEATQMTLALWRA